MFSGVWYGVVFYIFDEVFGCENPLGASILHYKFFFLILAMVFVLLESAD